MYTVSQILTLNNYLQQPLQAVSHKKQLKFKPSGNAAHGFCYMVLFL